MSSKTKILEDLFDHGTTKRKVDLIENKLKIEFTNLDVEHQFLLEEKMVELKDVSARMAIQKYLITLLSLTLKSWGDTTYTDPKDWVNFLNKQSTALVDKAIQLQRSFEKEIAEALGVDVIEENFSRTAAPPSEHKQSRPELTQEKEEVSEKA